MVRSSTSCAWRTATASKRWSVRYHYGNTVCVSTRWAAGWAAASVHPPGGPGARPGGGKNLLARIYTAQRDIGKRISHIVLMGIGEPLDNFDQVLKFLHQILLPGGGQYRDAEYQPVHLRPVLVNSPAGAA